jgi:hypothetical protein
MMSRLRANSITLRASASSLESQLLSEILLSNALQILKRTHANADYATQLPHLGDGGRESGASHHVERHISDRTPSPILRYRTLLSIADATVSGGAGEPPGHTLGHFCRSGSPKVLKRLGQNLFGSPSALRLNATQRTLTKRNNATLTQRRSRSALGRTGGTCPGYLTRKTQRVRHRERSLRLNDIHTIQIAEVIRERSKNSRHIQATRRRDSVSAVIFAAMFA